MRRWDTLVERYIEEYRARGLAPETVESTWRELDRWGTWLKHRRPRPRLEAVDSELTIGYLRHRAAFRSKATLSSMMSVMRGLGNYLVREKVWQKNPLRWLRGPRHLGRRLVPRRIDSGRLRQLVQLTGQGRGRYHRGLWLTVLMLLYGTGLRRGELERLDVDDWQRTEGLLRIDGRKTGRERLVPVPELAVQCLEQYLVDRHNHLEQLGCLDQEALLVSRSGARLKGNSISGAVQRMTRAGGLGRITLHQFRHTCASDLLEAGRSLSEVQKFLGHRVISTTTRYTHIADPQRHEAARRHPINRMLAGRPRVAAAQAVVSQGVQL